MTTSLWLRLNPIVLRTKVTVTRGALSLRCPRLVIVSLCHCVTVSLCRELVGGGGGD